MLRSVEYDPLTKTTTKFHIDDGQIIIEEIQDVQDILEANKRAATHDVGGGGRLTETDRKGIKNGWWKVASIPNTVIAQWLKLGVNIHRPDDWPKIRKLLNSPEWRYLRTGTGRV